MYRVGILFNDGTVISNNFKTKPLAEDYLLRESDKKKIKRADILNQETKKRERVF